MVQIGCADLQAAGVGGEDAAAQRRAWLAAGEVPETGRPSINTNTSSANTIKLADSTRDIANQSADTTSAMAQALTQGKQIDAIAGQNNELINRLA